MSPPLVLLLTALGQPPAADKPDADALTRSLIETTKATVEVLDGIKDKASAEKAKPRLEELNARLEELEKQYKARPEGERIKAELKWADEQKKQGEALTLAHDRVFARHKDAYKVLAGTGLFKRLEKALEDRAMLQALNIQKAALAHYARTGGIWPPNLGVLAAKDPDTGVGPFLAGGRKAITDPWGAPFQYEIWQDASGRERLFVWTVIPYGDGKTKLVWPRQ
jgi:hypothetical protein